MTRRNLGDLGSGVELRLPSVVDGGVMEAAPHPPHLVVSLVRQVVAGQAVAQTLPAVQEQEREREQEREKEQQVSGR